MNVTLAFDVYGTLIDVSGVEVELEKYLGMSAAEFSRRWREKQLEYTFRRGLMRQYETLADCTSAALDYTCARFKTQLAAGAKEEILAAYSRLPAFADVVPGLTQARDAGFRLFAFSNGTAAAVETVLAHAGIRDYFPGIVSVDDVRTFKPDPAVYHHFLRRAGAETAASWLVSGNPFDVIGAIAAGMRAAWVKRSPETIFDPWGIEPTVTVTSLSTLAEKITELSSPP